MLNLTITYMELFIAQCPYWKHDKKKDYYYVALLPKPLTGESLTEVEILRITRNVISRCKLQINSTADGAPCSETTMTVSVLNYTGLNKDVVIWGEVTISTKIEAATKKGNKTSWCDVSIKHYIGVYHVATSRIQINAPTAGKTWPWDPNPNDKVAQALDPRN